VKGTATRALAGERASRDAWCVIPPAAVVLDLDGTLIESRGDIIAALNHALLARGHAALPGSMIVEFVGDGARSLCARALELPEDDPEVNATLARFVAYYTAHPVDFTRWMPGAQEALEALARMGDLELGLCTNKPRATTDAVLAALSATDRFRVVVAGGDHPEKKPSPGPLLHAAAQLGFVPQAVVMVGDGPQDVLAAKRAGMRAVAVESGFASRAKVLAAQPDVMIASLAELPSVLRRWRQATVRF
jgi:phosphoglycolate phosphatase